MNMNHLLLPSVINEFIFHWDVVTELGAYWKQNYQSNGDKIDRREFTNCAPDPEDCSICQFITLVSLQTQKITDEPPNKVD